MTALHAPFYYAISIKFNSLAPGGKNINPLLLHTSLNIVFAASSSITSSSFPNLFPQMPPWKAPKRRKCERARSKLRSGKARTVHPSSVSSHFCVVVRCRVEGEFQQQFLWVRTVQKSFCKILSVWMYRFELTVWPRDIRYYYHHFFIPKSVAMTFPAEGVTFNFFWRKVGLCPSTDFISAVQSDGPIFHPQWWSVTKIFHHQPPYSLVVVG